MTRRRHVLGASLGLLLPIAGCEDDDVMDPTGVEDPAALLWDHLWTIQGTYAELDGSAQLPFPTDLSFLERIRFGQDGGPEVNDVLESTEVTFELDGRLLVKPAGAETVEDAGAEYRVIDTAILHASVRKSAWSSYTYLVDRTSRTLLVEPHTATGGPLMDLVLEVVQRTLLSGSLESAAARVGALLLDDPRVEPALDAFVFDLANGLLATAPVREPGDVSVYLAGLLRETALVGSGSSETELRAVTGPIADELVTLTREGIARTLVDRVLESNVVTATDDRERAEHVLRFALYRRALESRGELAHVRRVDLLLAQAP